MADAQNQDSAFAAGAKKADTEDSARKFNVGMDKQMEGYQKPNSDVRDSQGKHITVRGGEPPKMHDGGIVPKDGAYTLQKGETVIPKDKKMAKKHHKYTHTHIEHHDDGSHTTTHNHEDGKSHKKYASADHDHMLDGLMDHTAPSAAPSEQTPSAAAGAMPIAPPAGVPGA